ncbi:MAG: TolC family protein [Tunicatimonas sp.]
MLNPKQGTSETKGLFNFSTPHHLFVVWFLFFLLLPFTSPAQTDSLANARQFTLEEIVQSALDRSPNALLTETRQELAYWRWRSFRANYRPQLALRGNLPNFNRTNQAIRQDDGSFAFRRVFNNLTDVYLTASQSIGATGTELFVSSGIERSDNFINDETTYSSRPARIGVQQSLFGFNKLRWDRRIEPLYYEEARRSYVVQREEIAQDATELFFAVLLQQVNIALAQKNLANNDTIFQIGQGRYNLGRITEDQLLNLELNVMNSRQEVAQAQLELETSTLALKSFVGITDGEPIVLAPPAGVPEFTINNQLALQQATASHPDVVEFERRVKEARAEVARSRGENGFLVDINATYGLTDRGNGFADVYNQPEDEQIVELAFRIPVLDWGRAKSRMKQADALLKLEQYTVEQERVNFQQEVYTQVRTFAMQRDQVEITEVADDIAQRRYDIAKQRYLIGKIDITDLSIALREKDEARRRYIESLRDFWLNYYEVRMLTLYDFALGTSLLSPAG